MQSSAPSATWVPKAQQTATWRVFHKKWLVRVPVFQARTVEDVEHFGVFSSGESDYDNAMLQERRVQYMSLNEIYELFKRDVVVGIFNVKESGEMYEDISEHLRTWQTALWTSSNIKADPQVLEDLMGLDRFAAAMWPHAQPVLKRDFIESEIMRALGSIEMPLAALFDEHAEKPVAKDEPYILPERETFEDAFSNRRRITSWNGE